MAESTTDPVSLSSKITIEKFRKCWVKNTTDVAVSEAAGMYCVPGMAIRGAANLRTRINQQITLLSLTLSRIQIQFQGTTALHIASEYGHGDIIGNLIAKGADLSIKDGRDGATALHTAVQLGNETVVRCLVDAGSNLLDTDFEGQNPLHRAARGGHDTIIELFIPKIRDALESRDVYGLTALHWAVKMPCFTENVATSHWSSFCKPSQIQNARASRGYEQWSRQIDMLMMTW